MARPLHPFSIRRLRPDEWPLYREIRLRSLADSPDAFGGTLANEQARPDATWQERLDRGARSPVDLPLLAEAEGQAVGLAWGKIEPASPELANLYQMWVAPAHRGLGIGAGLLGEVIAWARQAGARELQLGVTCGDTPAVRLYRKAGFEPYGAPEPLRPGSDLLAQYMRLALRAGE
jgi:GNAT superfamily N-acetyltransferase